MNKYGITIFIYVIIYYSSKKVGLICHSNSYEFKMESEITIVILGSVKI